MSSPLIDISTARALDDVQFVDCRFRLGEHGAGRLLFAEGRIPGAVHLDLDDDLSGPVRADRIGGRHPLPDRAAFAAAVRRAGLRADATLVLYDDGTGGAARAWWLLRHHGVASRVLRGGIATWDGDFEAGAHAPTPGDLALGVERTDDLVDADGVQAALDAGRVVLDARAPARYRGEVEPMDPVAGHIPGALNAPFDAAEDVTAPGRSADGPPIAYCGSGVTACALILRLADEGRDDAVLYPGSWSDWCARGLATPAS